MDVVSPTDLSPSRLRHLVASGRWQRVLPRVYATSPAALSHPDRARASLLYAGEPAALSHDTGLAIWGLTEPVDGGPVHVTIPHDRRVRGAGFVEVHRSRHWADGEVLVRRSMPVLRLERCLVGACGLLRSRDAVRDLVARAVQSGRTTPAKIGMVLGPGPGTALARAVLASVAVGEHSALEGELAAILRRAGLPEPRRQHPMQTAAGAYRLDLVYEEVRLGIEADGAEWHLSPAAWAADLARQNALVTEGWTLLRFPAQEIRSHPERVAALVTGELGRRGLVWGNGWSL